MHPGSENANNANRSQRPDSLASSDPQCLSYPHLMVPISRCAARRLHNEQNGIASVPANLNEIFKLTPGPRLSGSMAPGPQPPAILNHSWPVVPVETRADFKRPANPKFFVAGTPFNNFHKAVQPLLEQPPTDPISTILAHSIELSSQQAEAGEPAGLQPAPQSSLRSRRQSRLTDLPETDASPPATRQRVRKESKKQVCKCKKTFCVRLYCVCFASQGFCSKDCGCQDCRNNEENSAVRQMVVEDTLAKNPLAFTSKYKKINKKKQVVLHARGCNCKKTGCVKQYCECYKERTGCTRLCRCTNCSNEFIELTIDEVKANYEPVQRKRRRSANPIPLWAAKGAADKAPKK